MACSTIRYPLLRSPTIRHYAAAAAAPQCSPSTDAVLKVLSNKVTIAAVDSHNPLAQVSVTFKAGSRHESYDNQGVSHMLRICTGLTTARSSGFAITRNIQQLGGNLTTSADREHISYTLQICRNNLAAALQFLEDAAIRQEFRPWEIPGEIPRIRYEVSTVPDHVRVIELLYKAAFREGLGNSLYCPKRHIGKLSSESLSHFVTSHCTGPRCAVTGSGVSIDDLELFAGAFNLPLQDGSNKQSKYFGGELRKERNSELASIAIAVEGASLKNPKEAIAFAVLQRVAGDGPRVKWGNCNNPLQKAVASGGQEPFAVSAFNASHSDSGLFGFILSAPGTTAGSLAKAGTKWLRSPTFSDSDVARGKASLKAAVLGTGDNKSLLHENIGLQALFTGTVLTPDVIATEIDKVSAADVKNAANHVAKGKLSMAAIGNLSSTPYIDQL